MNSYTTHHTNISSRLNYIWCSKMWCLKCLYLNPSRDSFQHLSRLLKMRSILHMCPGIWNSLEFHIFQNSKVLFCIPLGSDSKKRKESSEIHHSISSCVPSSVCISPSPPFLPTGKCRSAECGGALTEGKDLQQMKEGGLPTKKQMGLDYYEL